MSNPLLNASEQAHIDAARSIQHSPGDYYTPIPAQTGNALEALTAFLERVDWNKVFIRAAIAMNAAGLLYVSSNFLIYARYFGFSSLAFVGQLLIGLFFLMTVWSTTDGLRIMIASIGMYILANSF